jgi:hypothetical protein
MKPNSSDPHNLLSEPLQIEPDQAPETSGQDNTATKSQIISKVLSPAVRFWLRSQVERVDELTFEIQGGDRQILSGHVPTIAIAAQKAIYQGLHLSELAIVGRNIRINLGQVLRGKPLRLLEVVPIQARLKLHESDLNASLTAPLMVQALHDLLTMLVQAAPLSELTTMSVVQTQIEPAQLTLMLSPHRDQAATIALRTGLALAPPNAIVLHQPHWFYLADPTATTALPKLDGFVVELGTDVILQTLTLERHHIYCEGKINVISG